MLDEFAPNVELWPLVLFFKFDLQRAPKNGWKFGSYEWQTLAISLKRAKPASHIRSRTLTFLFAVIVTKILFKITDCLRFLETFSPLHFGRSIRYGSLRPPLRPPQRGPRPSLRTTLTLLITLPTFVPKSLFKILKISDLKGFLWDHLNKKVKSPIS